MCSIVHLYTLFTYVYTIYTVKPLHSRTKKHDSESDSDLLATNFH